MEWNSEGMKEGSTDEFNKSENETRKSRLETWVRQFESFTVKFLETLFINVIDHSNGIPDEILNMNKILDQLTEVMHRLDPDLVAKSLPMMADLVFLKKHAIQIALNDEAKKIILDYKDIKETPEHINGGFDNRLETLVTFVEKIREHAEVILNAAEENEDDMKSNPENNKQPIKPTGEGTTSTPEDSEAMPETSNNRKLSQESFSPAPEGIIQNPRKSSDSRRQSNTGGIRKRTQEIESIRRDTRRDKSYWVSQFESYTVELLEMVFNIALDRSNGIPTKVIVDMNGILNELTEVMHRLDHSMVTKSLPMMADLVFLKTHVARIIPHDDAIKMIQDYKDLKETPEYHNSDFDYRFTALLSFVENIRRHTDEVMLIMAAANDNETTANSTGNKNSITPTGDGTTDMTGYGTTNMTGYGPTDMTGYGPTDMTGYGTANMTGYGMTNMTGYGTTYIAGDGTTKITRDEATNITGDAAAISGKSAGTNKYRDSAGSNKYRGLAGSNKCRELRKMCRELTNKPRDSAGTNKYRDTAGSNKIRDLTATNKCGESAVTKNYGDLKATNNCWEAAATNKYWEAAATNKCWEAAATNKCWEAAATNKCYEAAATNKCNEAAATNKCWEAAATNKCWEAAATNKCYEAAATNKCNEAAATNKCWEATATNQCYEAAATNKCWEAAAKNKCYEAAATNKCYEAAATNKCYEAAATNQCYEAAATNKCWEAAATKKYVDLKPTNKCWESTAMPMKQRPTTYTKRSRQYSFPTAPRGFIQNPRKSSDPRRHSGFEEKRDSSFAKDSIPSDRTGSLKVPQDMNFNSTLGKNKNGHPVTFYVPITLYLPKKEENLKPATPVGGTYIFKTKTKVKYRNEYEYDAEPENDGDLGMPKHQYRSHRRQRYDESLKYENPHSHIRKRRISNESKESDCHPPSPLRGIIT